MSTAKSIIWFFFEHNLPKPTGRRSKGKGKGIRARDHARGRREEENLSFPPRTPKFPLPLPLLTPARTIDNWQLTKGKITRLEVNLPSDWWTMPFTPSLDQGLLKVHNICYQKANVTSRNFILWSVFTLVPSKAFMELLYTVLSLTQSWDWICTSLFDCEIKLTH